LLRYFALEQNDHKQLKKLELPELVYKNKNMINNKNKKSKSYKIQENQASIEKYELTTKAMPINLSS
jgi:hypothetical protein